MADRELHRRLNVLTGQAVRRFSYVIFAVLLASTLTLGQDDRTVDDIAPPPLRIISEDEKNKLAAETEVKRRTKLALELMGARLTKSEALASEQNFDQMFLELGAFQGLMDNMLDFLNKKDKESGKVLNNFKRFEIGLRGFRPRLELIRRDLPVRYEQYVRGLIKNVREARARAIEPLFDDTVVPEKKPGN